MRQVIIYIILLSVLGCLTQISAQEPSAQDDYVNSVQEKHNFNKKKWGSLKDRVINESGGAYSSENGGVEGSYYNYDNEDYDGKYSEYKNDDDQYLYEEGQAYSEGGGVGSEGDGVGSEGDGIGSEGDGEANYHPKLSIDQVLQ